MIFGAGNENYFSTKGEDGFKIMRYVYIVLDHSTYFCLIFCTLAEPVFFKKCSNLLCCCAKKKTHIRKSGSTKEIPFL